MDRRPQAELDRPLPPGRAQAREQLALRTPGLRVRLDAVHGSPRWIASPVALLSQPTPQPAPPPQPGPAQPAPAPPPDPPPPRDIIRAFLNEQRGLFEHGAEVLDAARLQREFTTPHSGLRTLVWHQTIDGLPVHDGFLVAHVTRRNELVSVSSGFVLPPGPRGAPRTLRHDAPQAVALGAAHLGWALDPLALEVVDAPDPLETTRRVYRAPNAATDIPTRLVWLPMSRQRMVLAWEVYLPDPTGRDTYQLLVDANSGEVMVRHSMTHYLEEASYRVFTGDSPTPMSPGHPFPDTNQPPRVQRELVTLSALDTNASPRGWIPSGTNTTVGNNIRAQLDRDGNNQPDLPRPVGNPHRVFDFPLDLDANPTLYGDASVVQLFYLCNWMHDTLHDLGFTEEAGNFQTDNFGRGGLAGDPVDADAQDGSDVNNANMTTLPDGTPGRLQMFLFTGPSPPRDSAYDAEVVIHEYVHGLSSRRVGAGQGLFALQSTGLGEGWSDFYAIALLGRIEDDPDGTYPFGAYVSHQLASLAENYYYGIRRYPYTTDLSRNPLTLKDIDPTQADPHVGIPRSPGAPGGPTQIHRQGEVWCVALWEVRARLIARHGFTQGQRLMLELVTDGMNLTPSNPTFLEARDGILQADLVSHNGANHREIWAGFARRGMGYSATVPPNNTTTGIVEAFDLPDDLSLDPPVDWVASGPPGGPLQPATQSWLLANLGTNAVDWIASADADWFEVRPTAGNLPHEGASSNLTTSLRPEADFLPAGVHAARIRITNVTSGRVLERAVELRIGQPDAFTELFDRDNFDLAFTTLTWTPDGSPGFYALCREPAFQFPVDPAGGNNVFLPDDGFATVNLPGTMQVPFYGEPRGALFIGSNGYLTFDQGDNRIAPSFERHFDRPRISIFFGDLDPTSGGTVSWKILGDRVAVTFHRIPVFRTSQDISCQIELFLDGRVRATWLDVESLNGLAGLSPGLGLPASFRPSDLSSYSICSRTLGLSLPAEAVEGDGLLALAGALLIDPPFAQPVQVSIENLRPDQLSLPQQVTVPAGVAGVAFDLEVLDDALLDGSQTVHVVARAQDYAGGAASMTVHDNESTPLSIQLTNRILEGAASIGGIVRVADPVDLPVRVHLASDNAGKLIVAESVWMPRGGTQVSFQLAAPEDAFIDGPQSVLVSATVPQWPGAAVLVTVEDNEDTQLELSAPPLVHEASGFMQGAGQIQLSGIVASNLVVSLQSSQPVRVAPPLSVTVPAGASMTTFDLVTSDNQTLEGPAFITLTASAPGWSNATAQVEVFDDESPPVPDDPSPSDGEEQIEVTADLAWKLVEPGNGPAALTEFDVYFGTSPTPGPAELLATTTNRFQALPELAPGTTYFWRIVARRLGESPGPLWQFTTRGLDHFNWDPIGSHQRVGTPFAVRLTARDERGTVVSNYAGAVALHAQASAGSAGPRIVISEVNPGTPDAIEFVNVTAEPVAIGNWRIWVYDNSAWPAPRLSFTVPAGTSVAAGQLFRLEELGLFPGSFPLFSTGTNFSWVHQLSGNPVAVLLQDQLGNLVDFMAAADADPSLIVTPATVRVPDWFGNPVAGTLNPALSFQRRGSADRNDSADWFATTASMGVLNSGLTLPFTSSQRELLFMPTNSPPFSQGQWAGFITAQEPSPRVTFEAEDDAGHAGSSNPLQVLLPEDVSLTLAIQPDPVVLGSNLLVQIEVFNAGPSPATGLFLTNALPGGLTFLSHTNSQGLCAESTGLLTCSLGSLAEGASARISILARAQLTGTLTNRAVLVRAEADPDPLNNNVASTVNVVPVPVVSVADAQALEGTGGTNHLVFTLLLSPPVAHPVSVSYRTESGSAQAGVDYVDLSGTAVFPPGSFEFPVPIPLLGDTMSESNETILLVLSNVSPGLLGGDQATGLILNDDPVPQLSIGDATVVEQAGAALLDLTLSAVSGLPVSVRYAALEASAQLELDFAETFGILSLPAGTTNAQILVPLLDDSLNEAEETFFVALNSPTNALLARSSGMVLILDDDPLPQLSISDAFVLEGDAGQTNATFFVSLSPGSGRTVSVTAASSNGTAQAGLDFQVTSADLQFPPGVLNLAVTVPILGDEEVEPDEVFWINLLNPLHAELGRQPGRGTILNNDNPTNQVARFVWDIVPGPQSAGQPFPVRIRAVNPLNGVAPTFGGTVQLTAFRGGGTFDSLLAQTAGTWAEQPGPLIGGYAFTPHVDLLLTHVVHRFGQRVSLWTEAGERLIEQPVVSVPGAWRETRLDTPVRLRAHHRYRIAAWSGAGPAAYRAVAPSSSPHVELHHPVWWQADQFPVAGAPDQWFAVSARFMAEATDTAPIQPGTSGAFTNGIWAGEVRVDSAAPSITLWAEDAQGRAGGANPIAVNPVDDLGVTLTALPAAARVGRTSTLRVQIRHSGPQPASNVVVNIALPANADLMAGFTSQGSLDVAGASVFASLGSLAPGAAATIDLQVVPHQAGSPLEVSAQAGRAGPEVDLDNNQALLQVPVLDPVTLAREPVHQTAVAGRDAAFFVVAQSFSPLTYRWHHQGLPLPQGTNATLLLAAVSTTDAGPYHCVVSDGAFSVTSRVAHLSLPPDLTTSASGFANLTLPPGYSMLANVLPRESLRIADVLDTVPEGATVLVAGHAGWHANNFLGAWSDPDMLLVPGEGFLFKNPLPDHLLLTLSGKVLAGPATNHLPAGLSLNASLLPRQGEVSSLLEFPFSEGGWVFQWLPGSGTFNAALYEGGQWHPREPQLGLGRAQFSLQPFPSDWIQSANTPDPFRIEARPNPVEDPGAFINFLTLNQNPAYGRLLDTDGITPLASPFVGQLHAGFTQDPAGFTPVGVPAVVRSGAVQGYLDGGLVEVPGALHAQRVFVQLRVWNILDGVTFDQALGAQGLTGRSAVLPVAVAAMRAGDWPGTPPPDFNGFPSFRVAPAATNTPPTLAPQPDRLIHAGMTLLVTNEATDNESVLDQLRFDLVEAPPAAVLGAASGVFEWTPDDDDAPGTNQVRVRVTDDGLPPLSDTASFQVIVAPRPQLTGMTLGAGGMSLSWDALPGVSYQVQYKNDLGDPLWIDWPEPIVAQGFTATLQDTPPTATQRFYRIQIMP